MIPATVPPHSPLQQQIAQMALELAARLEAEVQKTAPGQLLKACETLLLDRGRQFLRDTLAATLQQQVAGAEKKGRPPVPVLADTPAATKVPGAGSSSPPSAPSA
jgi:hypothetical protein